MLWNYIFDFFVRNFFGGRSVTDGTFFNAMFTYGTPMQNINLEILGVQTNLASYLCFLCTLISILFILVFCCLFIYRLIRLVGRLFSGGTL